MKPSTGTIVRTIISILAAVNAVLTMIGKPMIPIKDETIEVIVNATVSVIIWAHGFWKNNSFTYAAIEGDAVKDRMKQADVTFEEG